MHASFETSRGLLRCITAMTVAITACTAPPQDTLFIKGSDTMAGLIESWSDGFTTEAPHTRIAFAGGGSGAGMYALLNGLVDICASSRRMTAKEHRIARRKGLDMHEIPVARDGIAVIVHPTNGVPSLSLDQLAAAFTGTATSWSAVDGSRRPIAGRPIARRADSRSADHRLVARAPVGHALLFSFEGARRQRVRQHGPDRCIQCRDHRERLQ